MSSTSSSLSSSTSASQSSAMADVTASSSEQESSHWREAKRAASLAKYGESPTCQLCASTVNTLDDDKNARPRPILDAAAYLLPLLGGRSVPRPEGRCLCASCYIQVVLNRRLPVAARELLEQMDEEREERERQQQQQPEQADVPRSAKRQRSEQAVAAIDTIAAEFGAPATTQPITTAAAVEPQAQQQQERLAVVHAFALRVSMTTEPEPDFGVSDSAVAEASEVDTSPVASPPISSSQPLQRSQQLPQRQASPAPSPPPTPRPLPPPAPVAEQLTLPPSWWQSNAALAGQDSAECQAVSSSGGLVCYDSMTEVVCRVWEMDRQEQIADIEAGKRPGGGTLLFPVDRAVTVDQWRSVLHRRCRMPVLQWSEVDEAARQVKGEVVCYLNYPQVARAHVISTM